MQGRGFFLATPEMSRMSAEYRRQFQMDIVSQLTEHHDISPSEVSREHSAVYKTKAAILDHGNPFAVERDILHNMITHAYVPDEFVQQILMPTTLARRCMKTMLLNASTGTLAFWPK